MKNSSLIDSLLDNVKVVIEIAKRPLQKKRIKRGLDIALDSLEGMSSDAQLRIIELHEKLVTAKEEKEVVTIFNAIAQQREIILNCASTTAILKAEEAELFTEK